MPSRLAAALIVAAFVCSPSSAVAEGSRTGALAKELISLLDAAKKDCAAARVIGSTC